jgi:putative endonuclease
MNLLQVYILKCSDGSYYTGVSNDVEARVAQHNIGEDKKAYTYSRRPVILAWFSDEMDPLQAIELEKQIKGWRREKKKALIDGRWDLLPELSKTAKKSQNLSS